MLYGDGVMRSRMQKVVIALVALALAVPIGALGVSQLTGPQDPQQAQDQRQRVDPDTQPQPTATTKPEAPAVMSEQTQEGATATLDYLLTAYPYMMATGDTSVWEPYIAPSCAVCQAFVSNAKELESSGGWIVGGEFELSGTTFLGEGDPPTAGLATAPFSQESSIVVEDPQYQAVPVDALEGEITGAMSWDGDSWVVADMQLAGPGGAPIGGGAPGGVPSDGGEG